MKILELQKIDKLYFGYEDIAVVFGISRSSAKVSANRYVNQGVLVRLKRNMYVLKEKWKNFDKEQIFTLANFMQSPSYISLMSALDYYDITTQMQQNFFESIAIKRTKQVKIESTIFNFTRINRNLYSGFVKKTEFFIALPEKAFLDAIYLSSIGRYNLDLSSINFEKINFTVVKKLSEKYPPKTIKLLDKYENI